jgi:hypothetical protein
MQVIYCTTVMDDTYFEMSRNGDSICVFSGGACSKETWRFYKSKNKDWCLYIEKISVLNPNFVTLYPTELYILHNNLCVQSNYIKTDYDDDELSSILHYFVAWDIPFYTLILQYIKHLFISDVSLFVFWLYFQLGTKCCEKNDIKILRPYSVNYTNKIINNLLSHVWSLELNRNVIDIQ